MPDATNDDYCREIIDHFVWQAKVDAAPVTLQMYGSVMYQREGSISKATSVGVNPRSYCRQPAQQRHELHRGDYSHALSTVIVKLVCSIVVIYYVFLAG
mmetsp:Transcript_33401/g.62281  ORF Transcript_33401/g.62281 Transcript_33401/m.62281 type:complete len:99 (-) Transcript_33401:680-976(-)